MLPGGGHIRWERIWARVALGALNRVGWVKCDADFPRNAVLAQSPWRKELHREHFTTKR